MRYNLPLSVAFIFCSFVAFAQNSRQREIDVFIAQTGAVATTDKATNSLNFLRFPIGQALNLEGNTPEQKAMDFLTKYPALFEKKTDKDSYLAKDNKRDNYGLDHVTLQQYYDRVPVFDGVLKFHFNKEGGLTSLNGNFIIAEKLNATPSISSEEAGQRAVKMVTGQKMGKFSAPLKINKNTLLVFQKGLAQGYKGALHLVYEVEVRNDADVREFLYIDAHTNELVEQFTGMHGIDRKLYETSVSAPNLKWEEADGIPGAKFTALDQWQKSEIESAGHMYNLMKNAFGYNSYDNAGATMVTINNDPNVGCPNATWNGISASYCTGVASDDVVAHEWGHAYTEYTSGLIYAWQAGALNEAYSDIWGETVDQLNAYLDNGENNAVRNSCASSAKWLVGEQASAFGGAIRDMWDPTCKNQPGKVSDPQYACTYSLFDDGGGVHTNSGVLNHAYALLVDGGTYNGQVITGIGLTKATHIFWQAQAAHMISTTDFAAQADILEASLIELMGINLPKLSTEPGMQVLSNTVITQADLDQLTKVIAAVEMRLPNVCGYPFLFEAVGPLCKGALPANAIFYEDFESGMGGWTVSNVGSAPTWAPRNWVIDNSPPAGRAGNVAFADDYEGGDYVSNFQNGLMSLFSPEIDIPATSPTQLFMAFDHYISLQDWADGGNLKFKIDNGQWLWVPDSVFIANPYNNFFGGGETNPLQYQGTFTGSDYGSFTSNWGQSQIDLSLLGLLPGHKIQFRWDLGTDQAIGWDGWYIDDVRVYSCELPTVQFASDSSFTFEGEAFVTGSTPNECLPYVEKIIKVGINAAPSQPVTVNLNTPTGSASQGVTLDYSISPKSFVLQNGALSQDLTVRIYNDAYIEGNETISLSYTLVNPAGGNASPETFNQTHFITIADDDLSPDVKSHTAIYADFNTGLPEGWSVLGGKKYPKAWGVDKLFNTLWLDVNGKPLLYISGTAKYPEPWDDIIESPPFSSLGMTSINFSFSEYFRVDYYGNYHAEKAIVDVWDGTTWHNLLTQTENTGTSGIWGAPALRNISIPVAYANAAMKVRFHYIAKWDNNWWAIDNVKVTGTYDTQIMNSLSQIPDEQYLGPHATVYFRDPQSRNLIAKIKNLSSHDYGCTSVQVDRSGVDETAWFDNYKVTNKTFKVTPTNNSPDGSYEISLYYKENELPNFNGNSIKSMVKSQGSIAGGTLANSFTAPVQMTQFDTDFEFKSTFGAGFSGFALSNAPTGGALPVTLTRFEGKHTSEGNELIWETSSEVNNDYFVIERSRDARKFDEIARVAGFGTSAVRNAYSFTDSRYDKGMNYYRLKQVDTDGSFAYSRMIAIESAGMKEMKYFPNPVQSLLNIELPDHNMLQCNVKVFNSAGQCVLVKERIKFSKGKMSLDLAKLPAGVYQIVVSDDINIHNFSVVKIP
ncbi:M4 family metallopeptidase [Dyadobacter pollutisoli]|uniref:M4 family metallopeptidase n=1 Tax=Dyadobacter pollutisoli TaxID=2910158 RepID=A0A9E8N8D8_9BACT|nr:M4 family metallopeptidase [Dyadobacter pollutisoli]WAC11800.1 M4 family metallopeptidase [Dyadobacter pollutisoli]